MSAPDAVTAGAAPVVRHLEDALVCAESLSGDGFELLKVVVTPDGPEVWIAGSPRCQRLGGSWYRRAQQAGQIVWTHVAIVCGVPVKWTWRY